MTALRQRLVRRSILLAQVAALGIASTAAHAAVIDSGTVNIAVPNTTAGVYLNVVTNVSNINPASAPGWDFNPFGSGGNIAFFPSTAAGNTTALVASGGTVTVLTPGQTVSAANTFATAGTQNSVGTACRTTGSTCIIGIRFNREATTTTHFGYVVLSTTAATGFPAAIIRYAYDDTPNTAITVTAGGGTNTPPQFAYNPAAGGTVNFTGGTTVGSTGTGTINVTIGTAGSGTGAAATTTTTCTAPTGAFAGFAQSVSAIGSGAISGSPLTGTCTLGAAVQTQTLTCSENRGGTAVPVTFTLSCPAGTPTNTPPQFTYNPAAGGAVNFTGGGAAGSTGTASIAVTVGTPGTGTGAAATTTTTCTAPTAPFTGFGQTVSAVGNGAVTGSPLSGSCTLGATQQTQTLTCSENRGGTPTAVTFQLTCPAGTVSPVTSNPATGSTIAFGNITPGGTATRTVTFTNSAAVAQTVTCTATAAPFTTAPLSIPVPAGGSASTTITFTSSTIGTYNGTLSCTAGAAQFTFAITGGVAPAATSVPTLGDAGRWLALLLMFGFGLAALAARRSA